MSDVVACPASIGGAGSKGTPSSERKLRNKQRVRVVFCPCFAVLLGVVLFRNDLAGSPHTWFGRVVAEAPTGSGDAPRIAVHDEGVELDNFTPAFSGQADDRLQATTPLQFSTRNVDTPPGEEEEEDPDGSGLEDLHMVIEALKREKETGDGKTASEAVQVQETGGAVLTAERRGESGKGRDAATEEKAAAEEYLQRQDDGIQPYRSECRDIYIRDVLQSFAKPSSFLEPRGLKSFSNFLASTLEKASAWLSKQSEYYRQSVDPTLRQGTSLTRDFASVYEVVFPEAFSAVTHYANSPHQQSRQQPGPDRPFLKEVAASVERLKEISWQLDAVFGEVSGSTRAYPCPSVCSSLTCRWTCGLKKTLPTVGDNMAMLTSQVAMIFELLQELMEGDVDPGCLRTVPGVSRVQVEAAYEFVLSEVDMLRSSHEELRRLVKSCGADIVDLHNVLKEYEDLHAE